MPNTENIDRNAFNYDYSEENDSFEEICSDFKEFLQSKNRFISGSAKTKLLQGITHHYKSIITEQKHLLLINWATEHYIDQAVLCEKMSQNISNFESLVKISNDLKNALEPQYMYVFNELSRIQGGYELLQNIQKEILDMFLQCQDMSDVQKLALKQMSENIKTIQLKKVMYGSQATIDVQASSVSQ